MIKTGVKNVRDIFTLFKLILQPRKINNNRVVTHASYSDK